MKRLALLVCLASQGFATEALRTPEEEIRHAKQTLTQLRTSFVEERIFKEPRAGVIREDAARLFKTGEDRFRRKELEAAVTFLERYLTTEPRPDAETHLKAYYMLGLSYETIGEPHRAVDHFRRYLGTFITQPRQSENELVTVLEHLLPLMTPGERGLGDLIAPLAELKLSEKERAEVLYHGALALRKAGRLELGRSWLKDAIATTNDERIKAAAWHRLGLWHLEEKNTSFAREHFDKVQSFKADSARDFRDAATLGLARAAILERKPRSALTIYATIPATSPSHADALFETAYVQADLKMFGAAKKSAAEYLERYGSHVDARHMRTFQTYLAVKAGDLGKARDDLDKDTKETQDLKAWIASRLNGRESLKARDVHELVSATAAAIPEPAPIKRAVPLFQTLGRLQDRIADLRSDARGVVYTMGQADFDHLYPAHEQRLAQIKGRIDEVLAIGHRLVATERAMRENQLTPSDKQELLAAEKRRFMILAPAGRLRSQKGDWERFARLFELQGTLARRQEQLKTLQAELAAPLFATFSVDTAKSRANLARLTEEIKIAHRLEGRLNRAVELVSARHAHALAANGPQRTTLEETRSYATLLFEEQAVLAQYRARAATPTARVMNDDFDETWRQWEFVIKGFYDHLASLDRDIRERVTARLTALNAQMNRYKQIETRLIDVNRRIERDLGHHSNEIWAHYRAALDERASRGRKWIADVEWLQSDTEKGKGTEAKKQFDLEHQILNDNLRNLEQGATLPWQN